MTTLILLFHIILQIFIVWLLEKADDRNLKHKFACINGNQQEAYEVGVKI